MLCVGSVFEVTDSTVSMSVCDAVHASRDLVISVCDSKCPAEEGIPLFAKTMLADSPL